MSQVRLEVRTPRPASLARSQIEFFTTFVLLWILTDDNPVVFFEHKLLQGSKGSGKKSGGGYGYHAGRGIHDSIWIGEVCALGRRRHHRSNPLMAHKSLQPVRTLSDSGIEAEVNALRTLVPFDWQTVIKSVQKARKPKSLKKAVPRKAGARRWRPRHDHGEIDWPDGPIMRVAGNLTPRSRSLP
jgi:acetoin:2,6-dichlorophenolindophenol oxidoreductase subunit beta